jgi:hypothetical protein
MLYYECQEGMVITNNKFTEAAKQLAEKDPRIKIHDREWVETHVNTYFPSEIPEFNWDDYEKTLSSWMKDGH